MSDYLRQEQTEFRNIVHLKGTNRYRVVLQRDGLIFRRTVRSLESAEEVRDLALLYYEEHGRLPANYKDLNLNRFETSPDYAISIKDLPITQRCVRCEQFVTYNAITSYYRFARSDDLCSACRKDLKEVENRKKMTSDERLNQYIVRFENGSCEIKFCKRSQELRFRQPSFKDAVSARNKILRFYEEYFRLPSREELSNVLKIKLFRDTSRKEMKNIFYRESSDDYLVHACRKNRRFRKVFKDLDDAKEYRDLLMKFIKSNKRLPTDEEGKRLTNFMKRNKRNCR